MCSASLGGALEPALDRSLGCFVAVAAATQEAAGRSISSVKVPSHASMTIRPVLYSQDKQEPSTFRVGLPQHPCWRIPPILDLARN
jgi:hypothetical protein